MKAIADIMNSAMQAMDQVADVGARLQKEFEYFAQADSPNEKTLAAKKRQIAEVESLSERYRDIFDGAADVSDYINKLLGCLLFHGVSPTEVELFVRRPLADIIEEVREMQIDGVCQVPWEIRPLIDQKKSADLLEKWMEEDAIRERWSKRLGRDLTRAEKRVNTEQPKPAQFAEQPTVPFDALKRKAIQQTNQA